MAGVPVTFSASGGQISASTVTTDASGRATVSSSSGTLDKSNRTVTVTASVNGTSSAQIPVQIQGSTLKLSVDTTSIVSNGTSPATLTVTAKHASGNPVYNAPVTLSLANNPGDGSATLSPVSGNTDVNGRMTATVTGTRAGPITVNVSALGTAAAQSLTVSDAGSEFKIVSPVADPIAASLNSALAFTVQALPGQVKVRFASTLGKWSENGASVYDATVVGGTATATLSSTNAGVANVQAQGIDAGGNVTDSDGHTVTFTSSVAATITLQSNVNVLAPSTGGTTNSAVLTATVRDASNQLVGNAPVAFSIVNPTGGGETISPVVQLTSANTSAPLGQANATFTSGSLPSGAGGVTVVATVVGTSISASTKIVIGNTAGSVVIGQASKVVVPNTTTYQLPMSVLVADSNGNPVANTTVNLSAWPVQYQTGTYAHDSAGACTVTNDDGINNTTSGDLLIGGITGTFNNEDVNENLMLDAGEDLNGDGVLTPPNSAVGSLPATVTTDSNGVANFNLTYLKQSGTWIVARIRAKTQVQGTEATSSINFVLPVAQDELRACDLPNSTYR